MAVKGFPRSDASAGKRIALLGERYGTRIRKWDVLNETFTYHPRHNPGINDASVPADYAYMVFKMAEKYFPVSNEFIYNDGEFISFGAFAHDSSPMFLLPTVFCVAA